MSDAATVAWSPNGTNVRFHPLFGGRWSPEPLQADGSRYPSMGLLAAAWIQAKCGLKLDPWQVEMLRRVFLYDPDTLDWLVLDMIVVGPEGIGKSAFLAGIGLWLLDGPCLPPMDNPSPHPRPNIPVVSAALSLTKHIHRHASHYIEQPGSTLAAALVAENTKIFRLANDDHSIFFPAASGGLQQGGEPVPAIIEEELHVLDSPGVKATGIETIKIMSSKRTKNWRVQRLTITNPDDGDPNSLLGERWRYASKILDGEVDDPEVLVIHYCAALPDDGDLGRYLEDAANVLTAVKQATPSSWMAAEPIAKKYLKGEVGLGWFARFSLGLFYASDHQVLGDGVLEAAMVDHDVAGPPPSHVPMALAFDGARNRDSIALRGCTADGYGWPLEAWERPDDAPDDWRYDKDEVHDRVVHAMEVEFPNAVLGVDPTWFEDFVFVGWAGNPSWVERWGDRVVTDVHKYGAAAWSQLRAAIIDGEATFDPDPVLLRHMRNAKEVIRTFNGRQLVLLGKRRDDGRHPIDQLVTAAYAYRLATTLVDPEDEASLDDWRAALGVPAGD